MNSCKRFCSASGSIRGAGVSGSGTPRKSKTSGSSPASSGSRSSTRLSILSRAIWSESWSVMPKTARKKLSTGSSGIILPWARPVPSVTSIPRARHRSANSKESRLFPIPASPTIPTTCPDSVEAPGQCLLQDLHLGVASHEAREAPCAGDVESGLQRADALELDDAKRLGGALQLPIVPDREAGRSPRRAGPCAR